MDRAPYAYPISQYHDAAQDGDFSMTFEFLCLNRIKRGENEDKTVCCAPAPPCPHVPCRLLRGAAITAVLVRQAVVFDGAEKKLRFRAASDDFVSELGLSEIPFDQIREITVRAVVPPPSVPLFIPGRAAPECAGTNPHIYF